MDMTNQEIKITFINIIKDSRILNHSELEEKYWEFKNKIEPLYKIAIECNTNEKVEQSLKKLDMMLGARQNMNEGKLNKLTTDMYIGDQLGKEYIYPVTNTPSSEDYKKAILELGSKKSIE